MTAGALAALLLLAGCVDIPTGGSVTKLTIDSTGGDSALLTLPEAPTKGASQEEILDGFIRAGRVPQVNYQVAREYLTDDFRTTWNPNAGVLVSSSPITPAAVSPNELQLAVQTSATIDADGRYTTTADVQTKFLQYSFQKDSKGQWRISAAPDGTVLTPNRFAAIFQAYDLYFFDPSFNYLVPDRRWFADSTQVATRIVKGLLAGPSPWLAGGVVVSAFPSGTELTGTPVIDSARATVDLSSQVSSESATAKRRMTQQLTQSLSGLGTASASITVGGFPVSVTGGPEPDLNLSVLQDPVGFEKGAFGTLVGGTVHPLPGIEAGIDKLAPVGAAVGRDSNEVAVLGGGGVSIVRGTTAPALLDGRDGLAAPSLDPEGFVWSVPSGQPSAIVAYDAQAKAHPLALGVAGTIVSMAVSRDGTRLLVALQTSSGPQLLVAGIIRDKDLIPTSFAQPYYVAVGPGELLSASWVNSGTVVALSQNGDTDSVTTYDLGGETQELGSVDSAVQVVGGNGTPGIRVLDSSGTVFSPSGTVGWQETGAKASFLASQQ
jgi:hypothetical protein